MKGSVVNLDTNHFDYTEWRKDHLFVGETVDSLVDKIRVNIRRSTAASDSTIRKSSDAL